MKAIRANKEYTVTEVNKQYYLNEGYDITDDNGKIIEHSPKKMIKYSEYQKVLEELEKAKADSNSSANSELAKQVEDLTKTNTDLMNANSELTKQVEKLTKQLEKANKE